MSEKSGNMFSRNVPDQDGSTCVMWRVKYTVYKCLLSFAIIKLIGRAHSLRKNVIYWLSVCLDTYNLVLIINKTTSSQLV